MDRARLAEEVTAEVLRRLETPPEKSGVAVGGSWPNWRDFALEMRAADEEQALIVTLSPQAMVRLAHGDCAGQAEQFLLEMLLLGRRVSLAPQALAYHRYQMTAPEALYQQYVAAEQTLKAMGVRSLAGDAAKGAKVSRLLSDEAAQALIARGQRLLTVDSQTIITPLAADRLKAAQVTVLRQAKEAGLWS